ncbi:MAG: dimethyl sulfoxide reductase anchor subunit [Arenicella sp.]|nr:dimethyl sulfoxide reductase anchor subunit [Arenicella sp.]
MKPAFSVLFFTVTSGIGYGLLMWLVAMQLLRGQVGELQNFLIVGFIGLTLATLGLLSSTLHLANPKNAWRAFSRFGTSWLSREGVFSLLYYPVILIYAYVLYTNGGELTTAIKVIGVVSLLIALATVICTGMIYASLKPIRQWHNPLVTPLYLLFSVTSGALAYSMLGLALEGSLSHLASNAFVILLLTSLLMKVIYFKSIGKPEGSTIGSATGFTQAQVRLLDAGHNADTFLTKEFVFDAGAMKLLRLRWLMIILLFVVPLVLVVATYTFDVAPAVYFAMVSLYLGLFAERWLFFAEARHVVRLYHGDQRA